MQATVLRDSELWRSEALSGIVSERLGSFGKKSKGKERAAPPQEATIYTAAALNGHTGRSVFPAQDDVLTNSPARPPTSIAPETPAPHHSPPGPSQPPRPPKSKADRHQRKERERDKERKHRHRTDPSPLLADARAECILVAARKLGRVRAGIISGFVKERQKLEREAEVLLENVKERAEAEQSVRRILQIPVEAQATTPTDTRGQHDFEGSSSPAIPLALAAGPPASATSPTPRKLAPIPSPFPARNVHPARAQQMPTHLHPTMQPYPTVPQGQHPHAIPHPGFVYYNPGSGQGAVPIIMPMPWAVPPGTPPGPSANVKARQAQAQAQARARTPARGQSGVGEGPSTPMDSLVAARGGVRRGEEGRAGSIAPPVIRRVARCNIFCLAHARLSENSRIDHLP